MAAADVQTPVEPAAPALPDYVTDPDAVLKDKANWRYGRAPDYSKTRKVFAESKYINIPDCVHDRVPTLWSTVAHPPSS